MAKVKILDEQLANQIAAGEVVERPSSIVKELVENAIDAGGTTIDVTIEEGGLSSIRVIDNGTGIDKEDMLTAFERHATSKISTNSDLFRIASLGFRGEALPSIAAVAKVECTSSTESTGLAHKIIIEGGKLIVNEAANAPKGTDMVVKDLFFNTPARLKYMKTIQTELGHISDYMNRIALAHPGIAITLKHNGNMLLRTLGTGDRLQVIAAIYGSSTAKSMIPIDGSDPDYEMIGYVSKPELTRSNRNGITVIVNGRYIRSIAINHALLQAFHTLLPINRFPLAVIEIQMHPALLDVNVHPSKMEVRFSKEQELKVLIEQSIAEKLGKLRHIPGPDSITKSKRTGPQYVQDAISFHVADASPQMSSPYGQSEPVGMNKENIFTDRAYTSRANENSYVKKPESNSTRFNDPAGNRYYDAEQKTSEFIPADATERLYRPSANLIPSTEGIGSGHTQAATEASSAGQDKQFPELHWIGQHHGTYIIAQSEEGLYLIDQHAAHERINYEYYLQKFGQPQLASQQLIVPLTLEFTPGEASALHELLTYFEQAGVSIESFGQQTFIVRAYPEWFPQGQELSILEEMADYILAERKAINIAKLREKAAIMCACKASIKANDRMTREEGDGLLRRLSTCLQPYTCPHGRPIIVHLSTYQLEKMFKRVMS